MIKSTNKKNRTGKGKKLFTIGETAKSVLGELNNPVDATNRFINLALNSVGEDSQSRQFLLESKQGMRRISALLKRLNSYADKMEREITKISRFDTDDS